MAQSIVFYKKIQYNMGEGVGRRKMNKSTKKNTTEIQKNFIDINGFTNYVYIRFISLYTDTKFVNLEYDRTENMMKIENIKKIKKMALFSQDWNGTGGNVFSDDAICLFERIIETLERQPQIAPTGRNSLLMQYELEDNSILAFEVSEHRTEKVLIPKGDYEMVQVDFIYEDVVERIKECVTSFYDNE